MMNTIEVVRNDESYQKLDRLLCAKWLTLLLIIMFVFFLVSLSLLYFIALPEYSLFLSENASNEVTSVILNGFNKLTLLFVGCFILFLIMGMFSIFLINNIKKVISKINE